MLGMDHIFFQMRTSGPPRHLCFLPNTPVTPSLTRTQVKKISADNMKLCNRLVEISKGTPNPAYNNTLSVGHAAATGAKLSPANVSSAAVNRHKKDDKIAQENLALYKRLQVSLVESTGQREGNGCGWAGFARETTAGSRAEANGL